MQDIVVGILAIVIGGLFCFRGYLAMRVIIPIWGAFAGFVFGASLVTTFTDERFLRNIAGWLLGLVFALLFAAIAYLYYEISVVIVMASIGFTLGVTAMVALDVTWSWVVILVGVIAAVALAFVAIAADLPTGLLLILTALTGASAVVLGIMLLVGTAETVDFRTEVIIDEIDDAWWWWAIYAGIAIAGIIVQIRMVESLRTSLRDSWADSGGRELRSR
jgi:hypothetical protein